MYIILNKMTYKQRKILAVGTCILFGLIWYLIVSKSIVVNALMSYFLVFMAVVIALFAYFMPYIVYKNAERIDLKLIKPYKISQYISLTFGGVGLLLFFAKKMGIRLFKNSDILAGSFILFGVILYFVCYFKPFSSINDD